MGDRCLCQAAEACASAHEAAIALRAAEAHWGGLITSRAAAEIAEQGVRFHRWLATMGPRQRRFDDAGLAVLIWIAAATAREALHGQGRPQIFDSCHVQEVWLALVPRSLGTDQLARRLPRVLDLYRRFEVVMRAGI